MTVAERDTVRGAWIGVVVSAVLLLAFWQGYRIGRDGASARFAPPAAVTEMR